MRSNVRRSKNIVSHLFLHPSCDTVKRRAWLLLHGMAIRSSITKTWTMGLTFRRSVLMDEFLNTGAIKTNCGSHSMRGSRGGACPDELGLLSPSMSDIACLRQLSIGSLALRCHDPAVSKRKRQDEWMQDVQARQRNVVFPDTVNNEARFWRNIYEGRQRLTTVQRIGLFILVIAMGVLVFGNIPFTANFS